MKEKKHLSILLPATVICILAVTIYFQMTNGTISVSNTVNGKELPIYCVDTQEPKISISFDAAWAMTIPHVFWKFWPNTTYMPRFS